MKKAGLPSSLWTLLGPLFFLCLIVGQLQRIQLLPTVALYIHDVIILGGCLLVILHEKWTGRFWQGIQKQPLIVGLLFWIGFGWTLALIRGDLNLTPFLYTGRVVAYAIFTVGLIKHLPFKIKDSKVLYLSAGLGILGLGLLQYFFLPDTRFIEQWAWDSHYFRLISTQLDPNFTGMILVTTLFLAMSLLNEKKKWAVVVLITFGLAATFSRASYLAVGVGIGFIFLREWWINKIIKWEFVGIPILLGIFIVLLPKPGGEGVNLTRISTINSRLESTQTILSTMKPIDWWTGKGLFVTPQTQNDQRYHANLPDNFWVLAVSSLGVIGSILILAIVVKYRHFWLTLSPITQAIFVSVLVHTQFNNTLFQPFIWLFVTGIILGEKLQPKRDLK